MPADIKTQYAARAAAGEIERDPAQKSGAVGLVRATERRLREHRLARKSSSLGWLFGARERRGRRRNGLYLFGEVGRGKTMLMDLFFAASPVERKRRVHFHAFMQEVHERMQASARDQDRRAATAIRSGRSRRRSPRRDAGSVLRRVPGHRHRRRDDPGPAVPRAVRARRGGGRDLQLRAGRSLQGRAATASCSCRSSRC